MVELISRETIRRIEEPVFALELNYDFKVGTRREEYREGDHEVCLANILSNMPRYVPRIEGVLRDFRVSLGSW